MRVPTAILSVFLIFTGVLFSAAPLGKVVSVKGEAWLGHGFDPKKKVEVGDEVYAKDRIQTKSGAEVKLDLAGKSQVTIGPDSYFKLQSNDTEKTDLSLFSGSVKCKVKKLSDESRFQVKTPSAVAGVRGTEFETMLGNDMSTVVLCDEGEVWNAGPDMMGGFSVMGGEAGVTLAAGESVKIQAPKEGGSKEALNQVKEGMVEKDFQDKQAAMEEEKSERLLMLEERISMIESRLEFLHDTADRTLPGPPSVPDATVQ